MSIILGIIKTLVLLGVLIIIHEGGHFLVAKLCKIKVNEFSIGFGKLLWSKQGKDTKYSLRLVPLRRICKYGRRRRTFRCRRLF